MMSDQPQYAITTLREEFNEYVLADGNILKLKDILVSFVPAGEKRKDDQGKTYEKVLCQMNQINVVVPVGDADVSSLEPVDTDSVTKEHRIKKISFEPKHESLSTYEVNRHYVFVRSRLNEVWTTKFKDKNNLPIYNFSNRVALEIKPIDEIAVFQRPPP